MPNYITYVLLTLISILILSWLIGYRKQYKLLSVFFSYAGMIFIFEYVNLVLMDNYEFNPNILQNQYHDNILGSFVSNLALVPTIALLIAVYQLRIWWIIILI